MVQVVNENASSTGFYSDRMDFVEMLWDTIAFWVRQRALAGRTDLRLARSRRLARARGVRDRLPVRQSARHRRDDQDTRIRIPLRRATRRDRSRQRAGAVSEIRLTNAPWTRCAPSPPWGGGGG